MKKLIILLLVLGLATAANATVLTWSVDAVTINTDVSDTVVVQLAADDAEGFSSKWVGNYSSTVADITGVVALAAAGDDATVSESTGDWWNIGSSDSASPFNIASGDQYDVTIKGLVNGTYTVGSDSYGTNDTLTITVIPEPMTIALLGLGGLFLRRRK